MARRRTGFVADPKRVPVARLAQYTAASTRTRPARTVSVQVDCSFITTKAQKAAAVVENDIAKTRPAMIPWRTLIIGAHRRRCEVAKVHGLIRQRPDVRAGPACSIVRFC